MKLYILRRVDPAPKRELQRALVRASTPAKARKMVTDMEADSRWLDTEFATCVAIDKGEAEVIWVGLRGEER